MNTTIALKSEMTWQQICTKADLVAHSGVAAWLETGDGATQVALFYIPSGPNTPGLPTGPSMPELPTGPNMPELSGHSHELYAVDNRDPLSGINVIARGIVGDVKGEPVVASPLYKQHYRLSDGICLEETEVRLRHWPARLDGDQVLVAIATAAASGRI